MTRLRWSIVLAFVITLLLALVIIRIPVLTLSEQQGDRVLIIPLVHGREFDYRYIHSVQKTPVQEHFTAAPDNQLLLTSTTYQSFGVGLPFVPGEGKIHHIDGKYILTDLNRKFDIINIGYMALAHQELFYHGKHYKFEDYFRSGSILILEHRNYTTFEIMGGLIRGACID